MIKFKERMLEQMADWKKRHYVEGGCRILVIYVTPGLLQDISPANYCSLSCYICI